MPELTQDEAEGIHQSLLRLGDELRAMLESSSEGARPVDLDEPIGRVSRMDAMQQQSMAKANRAGALLRLQQVDAALERMKRDEFGLCASCGEEVGAARLRVRPEAPLCLACQNHREKRR